MVGLAGSLLGTPTAAHAASSEPTAYRLSLTQQDAPSMQPLVMVCAENVRCEGRMDLLIDQRSQPVTVKAVIHGGGCIITFVRAAMPLFVGLEWYGYVPIGFPYHIRRTLVVTEPTVDELADAATLLQRPVIRTPVRALATLDVDIRSAD